MGRVQDIKYVLLYRWWYDNAVLIQYNTINALKVILILVIFLDLLREVLF